MAYNFSSPTNTFRVAPTAKPKTTSSAPRNPFAPPLDRQLDPNMNQGNFSVPSYNPGRVVTTLNGKTYNAAGQPVTASAPAKSGIPTAYAATTPRDSFINSQMPGSSPTNASALTQLNTIRDQALALQSQLNNQTPAPTPNPRTPSPEKTPAKPTSSAYDIAAKEYIKSLGESDRVTSARQKYLNFVQSRDQGLQNIEDQTIPMQFITGQQRSLANRAEIQGARLQGDVALAEGQQTAQQNQARGLLDLEAERIKPIGIGNSLVRLNPATGQYETAFTAPQTAEDGFTLSAGQTRYDTQGNPVAGGGDGISGESPIATAYADAVLSGKTKLENIPAEYRGAVAQAISGKSVTQETSPYLANIANQGRSAIQGLLTIAESNPEIFGRTAAAPIPGFLRNDAFRNYEAQLDFLKGNVIPAALTAMREASKTGGALGQVSDREGAWLASSLGALSMAQDPETIKQQLRLIDESMARWQQAVSASGNDVTGGSGNIYDW